MLNLASLLTLVAAASATPLLRNPLAPRDNTPGFDYANEKVRGVNLGGWFVLEPFITPSLFEAFDPNNTPVDEYHYTQALGKDEAQNRLNSHWASWYTEDDFRDIANYGLNHVRIPIGYWAFALLDNDPYVQGQEFYLDQAIGWARKYGLKVWVDLHGAPGSQNGFDNSGQRDTYQWQEGNNVDFTLQVLDYLGQKYGSSDYSDVVTMIELLNEPLGPALNMDGVKQFYNDGYSRVRAQSLSVGVTFHDAFMDAGYWNGFLAQPDAYFTLLDHHHYQVFSSPELARSIDDHIGAACQLGWDTRKESTWRVVGEFSAALTDCTKWLNGVGRGARYDGSFNVDGTGSYYIGDCSNRWDISTWSDEDKQNSRRYLEAQLEAYDQGTGWIYWAYKQENAVEWDFRQLVTNGIFPHPFDQRQFPNTCGFD